MFVSTIKTAITNLHNLNYPDHDLIIINIKWNQKRIGDVMVSMLTSSAVDHGFKLRYGQTKDYKIGICCFSAKHAVLMRIDWLARNLFICPSGVTCLTTDCCFSQLAQ